MLLSKTLLTEDLNTIDWSKFNCRAVLHETTGHLQIVCDIKAEHPHVEAHGEGHPAQLCKGRQEWNNMVGM